MDSFIGGGSPSIRKTDFVGKHRAKTYAVGIDPSGKTRWDTNMITTEHAIVVLTEKVSTAYLRHLRDKQVSYIFAGKKKIDLGLALEKLHRLFGIRTARVDGGGRMWGSFLEASLIDEISHVITPVADGSLGVPTMFDVGPRDSRPAKMLKIKSIRRLPKDNLWIRYLVKA